MYPLRNNFGNFYAHAGTFMLLLTIVWNGTNFTMQQGELDDKGCLSMNIVGVPVQKKNKTKGKKERKIEIEDK